MAGTSGSVAHAVFDRWAGVLGRPWALRSIDLLARFARVAAPARPRAAGR